MRRLVYPSRGEMLALVRDAERAALRLSKYLQISPEWAFNLPLWRLVKYIKWMSDDNRK